MNTPTASNTSDPSIEEFKFHRNSIKQEVLNNALPIDPNSLIWKHLGSLKGMLLIFRTGLLQNMHPTVSRAFKTFLQRRLPTNKRNKFIVSPSHGMVAMRLT